MVDPACITGTIGRLRITPDILYGKSIGYQLIDTIDKCNGRIDASRANRICETGIADLF